MRPCCWICWQASRDAVEFVGNLDQAQFDVSKLHQYAVIRSIEIIGEATSKVSPSFQEAHPEIPWNAIVGMRHRLVHAYNDVDLGVV